MPQLKGKFCFCELKVKIAFDIKQKKDKKKGKKTTNTSLSARLLSTPLSLPTLTTLTKHQRMDDSDVDVLFDVRNALYIGNFQFCVKEAQAFSVSPHRGCTKQAQTQTQTHEHRESDTQTQTHGHRESDTHTQTETHT